MSEPELGSIPISAIRLSMHGPQNRPALKILEKTP
jgi:hypothetical protein